jgi:hypothetical protein
VVNGGKCLVAWGRVQRPLHLGGLGVLDLRLMGIAIRVRWLQLQRAEASRSWSALPVSSDQQTKAFFEASTIFVLGDGCAFKFWIDPWISGKCIADLAPELIAAVAPRRWRQCLVADALHNGAWIRDLTGLLTVPVLIQYLELREQLQGIRLSVNQPDKILWR